MRGNGSVFEDRREAGRQLAELLEPYRDEQPLIPGMPQGGVVLAYEVARPLNAPMDVLIVRKVGAPSQPEWALRASSCWIAASGCGTRRFG